MIRVLVPYHYTTVFIGNEPFYMFTNTISSRKPIACIPAGVSVEYRGKTYTTAELLTLVHSVWKKTGIKAFVTACKQLRHPTSWQAITKAEYKKKFIQIHKILDAISTSLSRDR